MVFEEITEEIQNNKQILNQFRSKSEFKNLSNLTFDGIVLIADSVKEALILIDEEARIIYWNRASEKPLAIQRKKQLAELFMS